jgi:hypothetical protein
VDAHGLGHLAKRERPELRDSLIEEGPLDVHDAFRDATKRGLASMDTPDEPPCRSEAFLDPPLGLVGRPGEQGLVVAAQAKGREPLVIQQDQPFPVHLADGDVGTRVLHVSDTEGAAGSRVETTHRLERLVHASAWLPDVARDAVEAPLEEIVPALRNDLDCQGIGRRRLPQL